MRRFVLILVFCATCQCALAQKQSPSRLISSLNYRALTEELLKSPEMQRDLIVTRDQLDRIGLLRARPDLKRTTQGIDNRPKEIQRSDFYDWDDHFKKELSLILRAEQIQKLHIPVLRSRFDNAFKPFSDHEFMQMLDLTEKESGRLQVVLVKQEKQFAVQDMELRSQSAKKILSFLSDQSKQRFVLFAGNRYLPEYSKTEDETLKIPLLPPEPKLSISIEAIEEVRDVLKLTNAQIDQIRRIEEEFDVKRSNWDKKVTPSPSQYFELISKETQKKIEGVLTYKQRLDYSRVAAALYFGWNPDHILSNDELMEFLLLTPDSAMEFRSVAKSEMAEYKNSLVQLNRECFEILADTLPIRLRKPVNDLFADVW